MCNRVTVSSPLSADRVLGVDVSSGLFVGIVLKVLTWVCLLLTVMSSNLWRDSDPSDDEAANHAATRKRSSRGKFAMFLTEYTHDFV